MTPNDKVLVWPGLVYVELISLIIASSFLLVWSIGLARQLKNRLILLNPPILQKRHGIF
ncbi:MAG: hypothetical protein CM1200mP10_06500 [Candidatus Neomarinimicrobiota bacterium]|nr:MAG: hypothetical protein CM1200mP10_06500 [Candidatus Neomarinimicrobiota bacterium]